MQTLWYTQYLLVMAVGMLIGSPSGSPSSPPGTSFFAEAIKNIPPTYELGSHGVLAVETLCLAGLYLQWCDRKHDAYVYVRLVVSMSHPLRQKADHSKGWFCSSSSHGPGLSAST